MQPILDAGQPHRDILEGAFNPKIFTASLSQVMNAYKGEASTVQSLYTDGDQFFGDAS